MRAPSRLERLLQRIVAARVAVAVAYALLVPAAAALATRIPSQARIDRLIVTSDRDVVATRAFQRVFPEGAVVLWALESDDPFGPEALADAASLSEALRRERGLTVYSSLDVYRRAHPGGTVDAARAEAFRRFATGTDFFRRQGLVGDRFLSLAIALGADSSAERDAALAAADRALAGTRLGAVRRVRKVGAPYVESWIEHASGAASLRWFPVFGALVVAIALFLYRSWRSLLAILLALGSAVALGVAAGAPLGFSFTVVSSLVPLTILVTTLANLVYLHSRFVDQPQGVAVDDHQVAALLNKFLPVTASTAAAVLGFAALAVSRIQPVREMGIWTAAGLAISWVVAFTLFPALQKLLRTPTGRTVPVRGRLYERLATALPRFTYRWRWPLLAAALVLAAAGVAALFGVPGWLAPMRIGVDSLDYVDPDLPIHRDLAWFREHVSGLDVARVWVRTAPGAAVDPEVLRGIDRFATRVEELPQVSAVVGPTTFLRMRRYLAGGGDRLPEDAPSFARIAGDAETLLLAEPDLRAFVDMATLSQVQLTVTFRNGDAAGYRDLAAALGSAWRDAGEAVPALRDADMQVVGASLVAAKVGASLVPTLTQSFAITAALIFIAFLLVFRSPSARLMAMIPSLFTILVTFLGMRLFGASLNVATILIATTILGTTENDQIHFFHHLGEAPAASGLEGALDHALRVSGRAIVFATFINAAGFLGLSLSSFPPLRQFGVVTAAAFLLAMVADLTALLAALWVVRREQPRRG